MCWVLILAVLLQPKAGEARGPGQDAAPESSSDRGARAPAQASESTGAASGAAQPLRPEPFWAGRFTGFLEAQTFASGPGVTEVDDRIAGWFTAVIRQELRLGRIRFAGTLRAEKTTAGEQTESVVFDPADRQARRAPLSVREAWVAVPIAPAVDLQAGRFEVAWGRTDGYSPADAFLPRDLSDPFADERLPLWGARLQGERGRVSIDLYHAFLTTPWRLPVMLGRYSPVAFADVFLQDATDPPPRRGFDMGRVMIRGNQWDLGFWVRTGVRPAPTVVLQREVGPDRPPGLLVPLTRRFSDEDGYGVEVVRGWGAWLARAEVAYLSSSDPEVGNALTWSVGAERAARNGLAIVTVSGNAIEPPVNRVLLFDRAFLPSFVATSTQLEDWGSWTVSWLATFHRIGGILEVEVGRDLTDVVRLSVAADLPHGSRTSSPGAISQARRLRSGVRWSW